MRYKTLGDSDLKVSVVGLGCNSFGLGPNASEHQKRFLDLDRTRAVIDAAFDSGVNFFDTADTYGVEGRSEEFLGEVLKDRRKKVIIATKWGAAAMRRKEAGGAKAHVRQSVEASLKRLKTDYIDLYQYHFPDKITPIAETLGALDDLKREGKIRYAGCSNFTAEMLDEADKTARANGTIRFVSVQNQYNLLETEAEKDVLPACMRLNIGFIPYFPLASGLLTGKYRRGQPAPPDARLSNRPIEDSTYDHIEALENFAKARNRTLLDLAFAGLAVHPQIASVIAGATKPEQIQQNAASGAWQLTEADVAELRKLTSKT